jgi:hypothetical protein
VFRVLRMYMGAEGSEVDSPPASAPRRSCRVSSVPLGRLGLVMDRVRRAGYYRQPDLLIGPSPVWSKRSTGSTSARRGCEATRAGFMRIFGSLQKGSARL